MDGNILCAFTVSNGSIVSAQLSVSGASVQGAAAPPAESSKPTKSTFPYDGGYPEFTDLHKSLMAKHLTPEIYNQLKGVKTETGFTIDQCIATGVKNPHLGVGCVANDMDSFDKFGPLFEQIIEGWHGFGPTDTHTADLDYKKLVVPPGGLDDNYIKSTRVRAGRSIDKLGFPPACSAQDRAEVERILRKGLEGLTGELAGKYNPLGEMSAEVEAQMRDDHFLFQKPGGGTLLEGAGAARDWPDSRGIYCNVKKTFLVWCNEEDHMRVISMQAGGDIKKVFARWVDGVSAVEKVVKAEGKTFAMHPRYGFVGTCPSNIGTGLRASMFVKLKRLGQDPHTLEEICAPFGLQPRGSAGEHSAAVGGWWDISNKARIGKSEVELVQTMIDGVCKLIEYEKRMDKGEDLAVIKLEAVSGMKIPTEAMRMYKKVFKFYDADFSGYLDKDEFQKAMHDLNHLILGLEVERLFEVADLDGSGTIDFDEFVQFAESYKNEREGATIMMENFLAMVKSTPEHLKKKTLTREEKLQKAFHYYDADNSGYLDKAEFKRAMHDCGMIILDGEVHELFEQADEDGNGTIDEDEFVKFANAYHDNRDMGSKLVEGLASFFRKDPAYLDD